MNKLDINGFYTITSFLEPLYIKNLGTCSKLNKDMCKYFMTYSYNEHGNDDIYVKIKNIKWIVDNCTENMFYDISYKQLNLICIVFNEYFNQPIEALSNCTQLKQLTFGWNSKFNQPIESLSNCTQLQQLIFGCRFNQSIEALSNCTQLQQLTFGDNFDQPVNALRKCTILEQIYCSGKMSGDFKELRTSLPGLGIYDVLV